MNILKSIFSWIVKSSADPNKFSLTLKAGIPFLVIFFGWVGVSETVLRPIADSLIADGVNAVVLLAQIGTGIVALVGLVRKIGLGIAKLLFLWKER